MPIQGFRDAWAKVQKKLIYVWILGNAWIKMETSLVCARIYRCADNEFVFSARAGISICMDSEGNPSCLIWTGGVFCCFL